MPNPDFSLKRSSDLCQFTDRPIPIAAPFVELNYPFQALVRAMAQIARAFGKKTVAEHVESGEVLELLGQFDIDYAQGYYTGAPVSMTVAFPALTDACIPFPKRLAT